MGHHLHAILGPRSTIIEFGSRWGSLIHGLPHDFAMVRLTAALFDGIARSFAVESPDAFPDFGRLSAGVEAALRQTSWKGPIAYLETDFFGGTGTQAAVAWENGMILEGPFTTEIRWDNGKFVALPPGERAINRVLARVGVCKKGDLDEFDILGLSQYRHTE